MELRKTKGGLLVTFRDSNGNIIGTTTYSSPTLTGDKWDLRLLFKYNPDDPHGRMETLLNSFVGDAQDILDELCDRLETGYYDPISDAISDLPDEIPMIGEHRLDELGGTNDLPGTDAQNSRIPTSRRYATDSITIKVEDRLQGSSALQPPVRTGALEADVSKMALRYAALSKTNAERLAFMREVDAKVHNIINAAAPKDSQTHEALERFIRLEKYLRQIVIEPAIETYEKKLAAAFNNFFSRFKLYIGTAQQHKKYVNDGKDYELLVVPPGEEHDITTSDTE
jgi:hypothetical protein